MKINLKRDRLTGILLVAMMFVGMNVSAQRIRVQGHITNPQGKSGQQRLVRLRIREDS